MVCDESNDVRLVIDDENALDGALFIHGWKLAEPLTWRQLTLCHEYVTGVVCIP